MATPLENLIPIIRRIQKIDQAYQILIPAIKKEVLDFSITTQQSNKYTSTRMYAPDGFTIDELRLNNPFPNIADTELPDLSANLYGPDDPPYIPELENVTTFEMPDSIPQRVLSKSMMNHIYNTDADGNAIDPKKTRASEYFLTNRLPKIAALAKQNPRFNRYIHPLYFAGTDAITKTGMFLDEFKDPFDTSAMAQEVANINQKFPSNPSIYMVPQAEWTDAKQYNELFVTLNLDKYPSYWDSLIPESEKRITNLLAIADNSIDTLLGGAGQDINNIIRNTTGMDPLHLKANLLSKIDTKLAVDSDDILYGAKYGLALGQDAGQFFTPVIGGFRNSLNGAAVDRSDPTYSLKQEIQRLGKKFKNYREEDLQWFLPYTDPAVYNLDERLRYGQYAFPDSRNFLRLVTSVINFAPGDVTGITGLIDGLGQRIKQVGEDVLSIVDRATNAITSVITLNTPSINHFLNKFIDANSITPPNQGTPIWDSTADVVLEGSTTLENNGSLVVVERHRDYVSKTPLGYNAKWFVYDSEKIFEDSQNYISNLVIDKSGIDNQNFKNDKLIRIQNAKQVAIEENFIFERVQQINGRYNGVSYDSTQTSDTSTLPPIPFNNSSQESFDPQSSAADETNLSVLNHIKSNHIDDLLGVKKGSLSNFDVPPEIMAANELQYFPLYIKTINRSDFQEIQQPVYDSGAVFLTKRRITGSSIVFLEAAIDPLSEAIQSSWTKTSYLGRTDPVYTYQSTQRNLSLGFTLFSSRPQDIAKHSQQLEALKQMMYPQLMAINEVGSIGYRRGPMCELRIGDYFFEVIVLTNLQINEFENSYWETLPGARVPKHYKVTLNFEIIHREQPHAGHSFTSPFFKPQVLKHSQNGAFNLY